MKERIFLSLGSNLGDRLAALAQARQLLSARCGPVVAASSIYETEPVDYLAQPSFLNQALELETNLEPLELLQACLAIECSLGRKRDMTKGPRLIDIDLLLYGERRIELAEPVALIVPHPRMHLRRFALAPLAEIAADLKHPLEQKHISELLETLTDKAEVKKLT